MRFAFIEAEKANFPVTVLCSALEVSPAGYYAWRGRPESRRRQANRELAGRIVEIHSQSRKAYGAPRITAELRRQGVAVSQKRVARLMAATGIRGRRRRRWVPRTTDSNHSFPVAPNRLDRNFHQVAPNKAWVGDITYIRTDEGWLYLATLIDLYSRKVVGWAMDDSMDRHLPLSALSMAVALRDPPPGLIHHSDRGSQYASFDYQAALREAGMVPSMSRKGNCWDNAVAESFHSTLKNELPMAFKTKVEAKRAIFEYIEVFYNRKRRHSSLAYATPHEFETQSGCGHALCA